MNPTTQENTLYHLMRSKLRSTCMKDMKKTDGDDAQDDTDEESAIIASQEMSVLVASQNMIRMVRKLHLAMLLLGLVSIGIMISALVEKWYGSSPHARGALQGLTVVFSFVLLIMWLIRSESPTNLVMLLFTMALASLSMGIVCGIELSQ